MYLALDSFTMILSPWQCFRKLFGNFELQSTIIKRNQSIIIGCALEIENHKQRNVTIFFDKGALV